MAQKRKKQSKTNRKKKDFKIQKSVLFGLLFLSGLLIFFIYKEETKMIYYQLKSSYNFYTSKATSIPEQNKKNKIIKRYKNNLFGIDVSQYQDIINWKRIGYLEDSIPISFVLIRATAGDTKNDKYYQYNWREAKKQQIKRGAYHYYRPNENSTKQAQNFIDQVRLEKGDFAPIIDIEAEPQVQTISQLRIGIKNWLNLIEKHYKIKPIIYTGDSFYTNYLKGHGFDDYSFWIANYNKNISKPKMKKWLIWQFSDQGKANGINTFVDLNVFDGNQKHLELLLVK